MNRPRYLVRDSILEALRRGASRIRRPRGVSDFAASANALAMTYDGMTGYWIPSLETHRLVMDYIKRRSRGHSPLALNDYCPVTALTDTLA